MNASTLRLAVFAPALLLIGASGVTPAAPLKCGRQPAGSVPIVQLDGAFAASPDAQALLKTIDPKHVESVEILCLNPQDSTVTSGSGIPAIVVTTKLGPASFIKPTLAAILAAQDAHFRVHSTYINDAANIALPFRSAKLRVSLDVRAGGWIAKATFAEFAPACYVFDGSVAAPSRGLQPRQPDCVIER